MAPRRPPVAFDVLLKSPGGRRTPTAATIDDFHADPEALATCQRWLGTHGVTAHPTPFGLGCSAPAATFESLFGVTLTAVAAKGRPAWRMDGTPRVPEAIARFVEDVTITATPEPFGAAG